MVWTKRSAVAAVCAALSLAVVAAVVAASPASPGNETTRGGVITGMDWEADIFHLPPEVAFPGSDWLNRLATTAPDPAFTTTDGTAYSSVYAAILNGEPLANPCRNFNCYVNSMFLPLGFATRVVEYLGLEWGHYMLCYLRNFIGGIIVYYGVALLFHYYIYVHPQSLDIFENRGRPRPSWDTIWDQVRLAQASLTLYVMLPVVDEFLVEQGWTQAYHTVAEVGGWCNYLALMILYFALVEIGIYWMHRTLHTNKWMYKNIHLLHHKYNKAETLTPWASLAFHPLDGILQASPYVVVLFFVPCHYLTHFLLLFFTAVWATYIHDAMDFNIDPIMGSKYHTVHHTHYIYNYGQVFTFCDRIWNTFREPDGPTGIPVTDKPRTRPTSVRGGGASVSNNTKAE